MRITVIAALTCTVLPQAAAQIVADFEANKLVGITPMFVQFANLSTYPTDPNVQFYWDFGDGNLGVGKDVNHLYETEGVFSVSLAIHVDGVEAATKTRTAYITTYDLIADFTASPRLQMPPFTAHFTNLTSTLGLFPTTFLWEFGDGSTSTAVHPSRLYAQDGVFDVTLHATADGKTVTLTRPEYIVSITPHPRFSAVPRFGVVPLEVQFVNATVTEGLPVTYLWDFGDGNTSTNVHPTHHYIDPGAYTVSLTVTTPDGRTLTHVEEDYIQASFETGFSATPQSGRPPLSVAFTNLTSVGAPGATYLWDFGDGTASTEQHPTHVYTEPGLYTVTLDATIGSDTQRAVKEDFIYIHELLEDSRTHFVAFPGAAFGEHTKPELWVTIRSLEGASGSIEFPRMSFEQSFTVPAHGAKEFEVPLEAMAFSGIHGNFGGVVHSDAPVQVTAMIRQYASSDTYAVFPYEALGREYRAYETEFPPPSPGRAHLVILATSPATSVVVHHPTGLVTEAELNYLDVLVAGGAGGTIVKANRPVAVFNAHTCAYIAAAACDVLVEQLPPLQAWGTEYVTARFAFRGQGDYIQLLAHEDDTAITVTGRHQNQTHVLNAGKGSVLQLAGDYRFQSDKPFLVTQFATGGNFESDEDDFFNGDPSVVTAVPADRYLPEYTIRVPEPPDEQHTEDYLNHVNVVINWTDPEEEPVLLDDQPIPPGRFDPVEGTQYMAARVRVERGVHTLRAERPFGLYVYGYAWYESYGHNAGMDYSGLNSPSVPPSDVNAVRAFFREIDANGDGRLSLGEVLSVDYSNAFFETLDVNGDGFISIEELLAFSAGPVGVVSPVYVDFQRMEVGRGTLTEPFNLLYEAQAFVKPGGVVTVLQGASSETFTGPYRLSKPMVLDSTGQQPVSVGRLP